MLKFLLDRILPKERSVQVDLPPMDHASDAIDALGNIIEAVGIGQIAPSEAAALASTSPNDRLGISSTGYY